MTRNDMTGPATDETPRRKPVRTRPMRALTMDAATWQIVDAYAQATDAVGCRVVERAVRAYVAERVATLPADVRGPVEEALAASVVGGGRRGRRK